MATIDSTRTQDDLTRLEALERQIANAVHDALRTVESFDIHEQHGSSVARLKGVADLASSLAAGLNELCETDEDRGEGLDKILEDFEAQPAHITKDQVHEIEERFTQDWGITGGAIRIAGDIDRAAPAQQ